MKSLLKFVLPLALVLFLVAPAWPAALTLSGINRGTMGPLRMMTGFATTSSADTLTVPFRTIVYIGITPRVAVASYGGSNSTDSPDFTTTGVDNVDIWYSISGSTITFYMAASAIRLDFFIIGF